VEFFTAFLKLKPVGKINEEHITILGPSAAVNDGIYTFATTKPGGKRMYTKERFSFVYTKAAGVWKILEHQSSAMS
jgi:hypothetical protein